MLNLFNKNKDLNSTGQVDLIKAFLEHKSITTANMLKINDILRKNAINHDSTSLQSKKFDNIGEISSDILNVKYASEDFYKYFNDDLKSLSDHFKNNRHHPEHFENGIQDMNLLDIIEMVCDWYAYAEAFHAGIFDVIEMNQKQYHFSDELKKIMINTVNDLILK